MLLPSWNFFAIDQKSFSLDCLSCRANCVDCFSADDCIKCVDGLGVLNDGSCGTCPEGTYYRNSKFGTSGCIDCPNGCKSCVNNIGCELCEEGRVLDDGHCKCPPGSYLKHAEDNSSSSREQCPENCDFCREDFCLQCAEGFIKELGRCVAA
jgi:hypothetical protein